MNAPLLVSGAILMGYAVAGLFFWRFWRETRDRLFAILALAFWLLAVQRLTVAVWPGADDRQAPVYLLRLLAYLAILGGIIHKNRHRARPG